MLPIKIYKPLVYENQDRVCDLLKLGCKKLS